MGFPFGITAMKCIPQVEHTDPFMKETYRDVSEPEERTAWFSAFDDGMYQYSVGAIHELDSIFCQAIMNANNHIELLELMDEIRSCERLHPIIKENLYLNIRNKL